VQSNSFEPNTLQFRLCKLTVGKDFIFFIFFLTEVSVRVSMCEHRSGRRKGRGLREG
jgi:hypothetical protein